MGLGGLGSPAPVPPAAGDDAEAEHGQVAYEALAEFMAEAPSEIVSGLVGAIQSNTPWAKLPIKIQQACADFEGMLFSDEEG